MDWLLTLPKEILNLILFYLTLPELVNFSKTTKRIKNSIDNNYYSLRILNQYGITLSDNSNAKLAIKTLYFYDKLYEEKYVNYEKFPQKFANIQNDLLTLADRKEYWAIVYFILLHDNNDIEILPCYLIDININLPKAIQYYENNKLLIGSEFAFKLASSLLKISKININFILQNINTIHDAEKIVKLEKNKNKIEENIFHLIINYIKLLENSCRAIDQNNKFDKVNFEYFKNFLSNEVLIECLPFIRLCLISSAGMCPLLQSMNDYRQVLVDHCKEMVVAGFMGYSVELQSIYVIIDAEMKELSEKILAYKFDNLETSISLLKKIEVIPNKLDFDKIFNKFPNNQENSLTISTKFFEFKNELKIIGNQFKEYCKYIVDICFIMNIIPSVSYYDTYAKSILDSLVEKQHESAINLLIRIYQNSYNTLSKDPNKAKELSECFPALISPQIVESVDTDPPRDMEVNLANIETLMSSSKCSIM